MSAIIDAIFEIAGCEKGGGACLVIPELLVPVLFSTR